MNKNEVLEKIKHKLIVSCQARPGWAMYGADIMAAFAKAAEEGGAAGIRATGVDNITKIKEKVNLPIIGINKQFSDYPVYITPTYQSAKDILDCGIEIVALDATPRQRPNDEKIEDIVRKIRENYPDVLIMGEISTLQEAKDILPLNFDLISTTLSGYTKESENVTSVNLELIKQITKKIIPKCASTNPKITFNAAHIALAASFIIFFINSLKFSLTLFKDLFFTLLAKF